LLQDPPQLFAGLIEIAPISCNGVNDAIIAAVPNGGTAPYSYLWNGIISIDSTLSDQGPGTYTLDVVDVNGCVASSQITLVDPPVLEVSGTTTSRNCVGPPDGTASIVVNGGNPDYSFTWSDPTIGDTATPTDLAAGDYQVTVTDNSGCSEELSLTVDQEPEVQLLGDHTNVDCYGAATGEITTNITAGEAPFVYDWRGPGNPNGNEQLSNISIGTYQVVVTDSRGCMDSLSFTLTQPDSLMGSARITPVACGGQSTGAIDWSGGGGVLPYAYSWSNNANTEDLEGLPTGSYTLQLRDANNCLLTQSYTVPENPPIEVESVVDPVSCAGRTDGGIFPIIRNGFPPYDLNWISSNGMDTFSTATLSNISAGLYTLTGTDGNGCTFGVEVSVPEPTALSLEVVAENVRCYGEDNGFIELNPNGGTPNYQFRLRGESWIANNTFVGLRPGNYLAEVRDDNGCTQLSEPITISEPNPFQLSLGEDRTVIWGDSLQLFPIIILGGNGANITYEWMAFDSTVLSCFDCGLPWIKPLVQTTIQLLVTDELGCTAEDVITFFISKDYPLQVPTGFTPNGDGQNDRLIVHGLPGVEVIEFQVFDQWGQLVWQANNIPVNDFNSGWDGRFRDEPLSGNFVWRATARLPDGSEETFQGETSLLR
ncbi:MAG: gliding motility-associated C-terminal domain-containing protein, partial [Bacteroidota bacterium]